MLDSFQNSCVATRNKGNGFFFGGGGGGEQIVSFPKYSQFSEIYIHRRAISKQCEFGE